MSGGVVATILREPWTSAPAVLEALLALEIELRRRGDRRAVFATAYVHMTGALARRLDAGVFADREWIEQLIVRFADYYRAALDGHERGEDESLPRIWRLTLDTARSGGGLVIQDLLLGMIAHIVHDLPLAVADVAAGRDEARCRRDYLRVLDAVMTAIDHIQDEVAAAYAPGLGALDDALARFDEWVFYATIRHYRARSFERAMAIVRDPALRPALEVELDREACRYAKALLSPTERPGIRRALEAVEAFDPRRSELLRALGLGTPGPWRVDAFGDRVWVSVERVVGAPPHEVWPWLTHPRGLERVLDHVALIAPGEGEDPAGVGSLRLLSLSTARWEEVVIAAERPARFVTRVVVGGRAARFGSRLSLEARGEGTLVRWTHELPRRGALDRALAERAIAPRLARALDVLAEALDRGDRLDPIEEALGGDPDPAPARAQALSDAVDEEAEIARRLARQGSLVAHYAELHVARTRAELAACARAELPHPDWALAQISARSSRWRDVAGRYARFGSLPGSWARTFAAVEELPRAPILGPLRAIAACAEAHARASHRDAVVFACRTVGAPSPSRFRGDELILSRIESESFDAVSRRALPAPLADALAARLFRPIAEERRRAFEAVARSTR